MLLGSLLSRARPIGREFRSRSLPGPTTDAEFGLLALPNPAELFELASDSRKGADAKPDSVGQRLASERARAKVLIVEDEALVALDICDLLSDAGYEVVGLVATEQDAIAKASELQPDLIIFGPQAEAWRRRLSCQRGDPPRAGHPDSLHHSLQKTRKRSTDWTNRPPATFSSSPLPAAPCSRLSRRP